MITVDVRIDGIHDGVATSELMHVVTVTAFSATAEEALKFGITRDGETEKYVTISIIICVYIYIFFNVRYKITYHTNIYIFINRLTE